MNLLEGKLVAEEQATYFQADQFRVLIPSTRARRLHDRLDREITFGVRPEHLQLLAADSTETGIEVTVVLSQLLGAETIVEVDYGAGRVFARVDNQQQLEAQQPMMLSVDTQHIHFFDPKSQLAI
ncbi:MAG: TOBE domain-containing protein [Pseudomonadales bacterium]|nr:TOBE domain-containing protein [Pseudomonadales bacterium]